jgi:hypothetical protein
VHRLDQWAAVLLADLLAVFGRVATDIGLDRIQRADPLQRFVGEWRLSCCMDVVEFPSCVRPTKGQDRCVVRCAGDQAAKPGITIDLKQPAEALQMGCRMLALTIFTIDIRGRRMTGSRPRTVVDRVAPQPPGLGAAAARIQHRQRGIVGNHLGRGQDRAQDQRIQRLQPPAGASDPVAQRGTIQIDALACEYLRLTIQRKVVGIFVDQNVGQQSFGRHAAVDRPFRRGRLHDAAVAGPTAIARPADHLNADLRGDVIQHLGPVFADRMQGRTTALAGLVGDIDHDLRPRQMLRQRTAIALRWLRRPFLGWLSRFELRLLFAQRLLGVLDPLLQRLFAETFRAAAKAVAQQNRDQHL